MTNMQRTNNDSAMDKPDYHALAQTDPRYRTLKNGAIFDNETNRIVAAPPRGQNTFDNRELARAAAQKRVEKRIAAIESGMIAASGGNIWYAIAAMSANLTKIAMQGKDMTAVRAYQTVLKTGHFLPEHTENGTNGKVSIELDRTIVRDLLGYLANKQ